MKWFSKAFRRQRGFSMAEVLIAMALFAASVTGIAGMLISGGSLLTKGARESVAVKLATQKIEQVNPLPFYVPWDGVNQDIDDYFYTEGIDNDQQFTDLGAGVTEDYGDISGYATYKRRTAVKYIVGTASGFADAVMKTNWVPKDPTGLEFDVPEGKVEGGPEDNALHGLIVEVRVWYKDANGIERELVENALISDRAAASPVLVINRVDPTHTVYNNPSLELTAHVVAPGLGEPGQTVTMKLWHEGKTDIVGTSPTIEGNGARVVASFNLAGVGDILPGMIYHVDVTWNNEGFTYSLLNCFTMDATAPGISTIVDEEPGGDYHIWGYGQQSGRKVKITGTDLYETEIHLISPDGVTDISGTVDTVANPYTEATATFNLGPATDLGDGTWDVMVKNETADGNQLDDAFRMNPKPEVTQVATYGTDSGYEHFNWMYRILPKRYVKIEGNYLCGLEDPSSTMELTYSTYELDGEVKFGPTGNSCNRSDPVMLEFNPSSVSLPLDDSWWNPEIINICNPDAATISNNNQRVRMNPAAEVTSIDGWNNGYRKVTTPMTITVHGNYFRGPWDDAGGNWPMVWLQNSAESISLNFDSITDWNTRGTWFKLTQTYAANKFHYGAFGWQAADIVPGTEPILGTDTTYKAVIQMRSDNWPKTYPDPEITRTIEHAPIAITAPGSWSVARNDWDIGVGTITGNYFAQSADTKVELYTSGGSFAAANPSSIDTITGAESVGGSYGGGQTISGLSANTIDLAATTYRLRVTDTENGRFAQKNFAVSNASPSVPYYISPASCKDNGTRSFSVRAKRLYGSSRYQIDLDWRVRATNSHWSWETKSSGYDAVTTNRASKYVQVTASIAIPYKYSGFLNSLAIIENGIKHELRVTNPTGTSGWWSSGAPHPTIVD